MNRMSLVLLSVYTAVVAWAFYEQATDWPHVGSWATVAYFFLCPGIVFQLVSLAYTRHTGKPLTRRWLTRLGTIPAGLLLAGAGTSVAENLSQSRFEQAYAPFVAKVGLSLPSPCTVADYFQIPAVANYNRAAGRERPSARLRHDNQRFVLAFSGGSSDIDGSTIYYDSAATAWRKFHNDDTDGSKAYDDLAAGLQECRLSVQ